MADDKRVELKAGDAMGHALRIGLAAHPRFAGAVHQRLILDCLYDIPTQRLDLNTVISEIAARFDGIRLMAPQAQTALDDLRANGWIDADDPNRSGTRRYFLSARGIKDWEEARTNGRALEKRVKEDFCRSIGLAGDGAAVDEAWNDVLDALENLLRREAFEMARVFVDDGDIGAMAAQAEVGGAGGGDHDLALKRLGTFLRGLDGDRQAFLRRFVTGSLAYQLFRASPTADVKVRAHLQGRTYYLDTSILYSLAARQGDLVALRDDLVRVSKDLDLKLRVSRQTLVEFQDSVRHYKALLERHAITNGDMARALLSQEAIEDLDDFRRGYYQEVLSGRAITLDVYAQRFETIEEQLYVWNIPKASEIVTAYRQDEAGQWTGLEHLSDYESSWRQYLTDHPRKGREGKPLDDSAPRHDATMVAFVQQQRKNVAVPTKASQVDIWFLTRDRKLAKWDSDFIASERLGSVPRCLTLEDWLEALAVLVPSIRDSEVANAIALRELALTCPSLKDEEQLSANDLELVGRAAGVFEMHPEEAARVAADKQFARDVQKASGVEKKIDAVTAGIVRMKNQEIGRLEAESAASRSEAEKAAAIARIERAKRQRNLARQRSLSTQLKKAMRDQSNRLVPDAEFGRSQRVLVPIAVVVAIVLTLLMVAIINSSPQLWHDANGLQRVYVLFVGSCLILAASLFVAGHRRGALVFTSLAGALHFFVIVTEGYERLGNWQRKQAGSLETRPGAATAPPNDTSRRTPEASPRRDSAF